MLRYFRGPFRSSCCGGSLHGQARLFVSSREPRASHQYIPAAENSSTSNVINNTPNTSASLLSFQPFANGFQEHLIKGNANGPILLINGPILPNNGYTGRVGDGSWTENSIRNNYYNDGNGDRH